MRNCCGLDGVGEVGGHCRLRGGLWVPTKIREATDFHKLRSMGHWYKERVERVSASFEYGFVFGGSFRVAIFLIICRRW